mmetsp:Transcript_13100/g.38051  ORF Transcript_13100/g.38051 Transcript_13100/m.38051 type:complete len:203 (-) Transcript_13100:192-800(-)
MNELGVRREEASFTAAHGCPALFVDHHPRVFKRLDGARYRGVIHCVPDWSGLEVWRKVHGALGGVDKVPEFLGFDVELIGGGWLSKSCQHISQIQEQFSKVLLGPPGRPPRELAPDPHPSCTDTLLQQLHDLVQVAVRKAKGQAFHPESKTERLLPESLCTRRRARAGGEPQHACPQVPRSQAGVPKTEPDASKQGLQAAFP